MTKIQRQLKWPCGMMVHVDGHGLYTVVGHDYGGTYCACHGSDFQVAYCIMDNRISEYVPEEITYVKCGE